MIRKRLLYEQTHEIIHILLVYIYIDGIASMGAYMVTILFLAIIINITPRWPKTSEQRQAAFDW